ncbi:hypothetical protein C5167_015441 [Papaver somniferum]|uniref:RNA helicase n=1 Tax=Papaver somniferum TaxID=3469 RepID=A0A4Y7J952_PAPSO|nr:hypothetical protein C5167_015441 [Papaver somniferum]
MAAKAKSSLSSSKRKLIRSIKKAAEDVDSLPWKSSVSKDEDPFALPQGANDFDGGFISLDEIDEVDYGVLINNPFESKKRTRTEDSGDDEEKVDKKVKKLKAKKKKKKKSVQVSEGDSTSLGVVKDDSDNKVEIGETVVDEAEFYEWKALRLHPLLLKSIYKLGFKEPTPIQKVCIPAAAHQGKVGCDWCCGNRIWENTCFWAPILQRLLQEREKAGVSLTKRGSDVEKGALGNTLRALIITPTRELALQVTDHLKVASSLTNIRVVPIVGGISSEKQERLLKARPEIIVGTPGRLWELMQGGDPHLVELHSLSFFVLDEADRMIESGHFQELQSIIDMLPMTAAPGEGQLENSQSCVTVSNIQRQKRQTFVFSATIALSSDFRKKLKGGSRKSKQSLNGELSSIEKLSERAGMRADAAIFDLTNAAVMADKLEESFIECREEDKDAYLYYLLSVHGQGRTIVFCTSIAALRHISSLLRLLGINLCPLHSQMQQRARLKAMDRFRESDNGILIATDIAARGLDIAGVRTVIHYQLPHSAGAYVHRSGRTARASADGCSIALINPNDKPKFSSLCKSFQKESLRRFPLDNSYMPEVMKRLSIARQIDKITHNDFKEKVNKTWLERNAKSVELVLDEDDSEEERVNSHKQRKAISSRLIKLQTELKSLLSRPLQPKSFSHRFLAGSGVSPLLQHQFQELSVKKLGDNSNNVGENRKSKLLVIGQDCIEPLQALRSGGHEVSMNVKETSGSGRKIIENAKRKKREAKNRAHDQKRKDKKRQKSGE